MTALDVGDYWTRATIRALAGLDADWYSEDEAAWSIFMSDQILRGRTRQVLEQLAAQGVLDRMAIRHRGKTIGVYLIDPERLTALLDRVGT